MNGREGTYAVRLRHDAGTVRITTYARNADAAVGTVLKCEDAPRSAVLDVRQVTEDRNYA